jgi:hypothetical protein
MRMTPLIIEGERWFEAYTHAAVVFGTLSLQYEVTEAKADLQITWEGDDFNASIRPKRMVVTEIK